MKLAPHYRPQHKDWSRFFQQLPLIKERGFPVCISGGTGTGKEFVLCLIRESLGIQTEHELVIDLDSCDLTAIKEPNYTKIVAIRQHSNIPAQLQERLLPLLKKWIGRYQIVWMSVESLAEQFQNGQLSEELLYALNIFDFRLPDLSEMSADFRGFVDFFLSELSSQSEKVRPSLSDEQVAQLKKLHWPANLDSLKFILKRSIAQTPAGSLMLDLATGPLILKKSREESDRNGVSIPGIGLEGVQSLERSVNEFKKHLVIESIKLAGGNKSNAAKLLGVSKAYIFRLINMLDIKLD